MRIAIARACLAGTIGIAALQPRASNAEETLYENTGRAIGFACAEFWELKDVAAVDAREKMYDELIEKKLDRLLNQINELKDQLKEAKLEYNEKDSTLNKSVIKAAEDLALTGGEVDTKDLKTLGKSIAQGGSAAGSVGGAEIALTDLRSADTRVADLREKLARAIVLRKMFIVVGLRVKGCAADQRKYLAGKPDTSQEGNGAGLAGTVAGDATLKCEEGVPPPGPNRKWEEKVRFSIRLNPPQNASQASIGHGTFDFAGVSHNIAGFAASDGNFVASGKSDYQTITMTGKLGRNGAGSLTSSGSAKVSLESRVKLVGAWLGTLCEGTYSF